MINMKKKNVSSIVTTHNLGKIILEKQIVPTPIYTSGRETSYIVKPRGTIFSKIRRGKSPKF